jgi:hypothetical protein
VELMMTFSSYGRFGKGVGSLPVAMIMFLAVIVLFPDSPPDTEIVLGSVIFAHPLMLSTLFLPKRPAIPLVSEVTISVFFFWTWPVKWEKKLNY